MEKMVSDFGKFIRYKRLECELTQLEFGRRLNVPFQNVSRLERGKINPTLVFLGRLSEAFDLSLEAMMGEFKIFRG